MLGKIIAHGATREEARRKLLRAVQDTVLLGVQSNQRLLASLLDHPQFISGNSAPGSSRSISLIIPAFTHAPGAEELAAAALFYQAAAQSHRPLARLAQQRQCAAPLSGFGEVERGGTSCYAGKAYRIRIATRSWI
jgi:geranyl-CoA carboxylase alpha subunit